MAEDLAADREEAGRAADRARIRLAGLQVDAAEAYAAITAADVALRVLAERRVAAERVLRHAAARQAAASRALDAHARARPGLLAQLAARLRAWPEWRAAHAALVAALAATGPPLADARRSQSQAREEFAAQVQERAEAASELRRLTAACAQLREELVACEEHAGPGRGPRERRPDPPLAG